MRQIPKLQFQYYYRTNKCLAKEASDPDCVCWYDEGVGPYMDQRHDDAVPLVEWRIKPNDRSRPTVPTDEEVERIAGPWVDHPVLKPKDVVI